MMAATAHRRSCSRISRFDPRWRRAVERIPTGAECALDHRPRELLGLVEERATAEPHRQIVVVAVELVPAGIRRPMVDGIEREHILVRAERQRRLVILGDEIYLGEQRRLEGVRLAERQICWDHLGPAAGGERPEREVEGIERLAGEVDHAVRAAGPKPREDVLERETVHLVELSEPELFGW
jgi:hypothetical protein